MTASDFHAHTSYCDGTASPRAMVEAAFAKGLVSFGLSGHAPLPFASAWTMEKSGAFAYRDETLALKEEYRGRMEVLLGMEIDWLDEAGGPARTGAWGAGLDYRIGSVHFIRAEDGTLFTVDAPENEFLPDLAAHCPSGPRLLVEDYYARVAAMAAEGGFDVMGHFDLPKKNNQGERLFRESDAWYRDAVMAAVEAVASSGAVVEVNTGGIARKRIEEPYPAPWILREFEARGVRAAFSSDAHRSEDILSFRDRAFSALREAGYGEIHYLTGGGWRGEKLEA